VVDFDGRPDVFIKKGKLDRPNDTLPKTVYKPNSVFNSELFYLDVLGIARYQLNGHTEIIVDKYDTATGQDVLAFLFDSIFTVLLVKNDIFVFHASAVSIGKKAYMFCGPAGIGKTTLALTLAARKGARIIEDDKCLVQYNKRTDKFMIKNQYPFVELWKPQLKLATTLKGVEPISQVRKNIQKFRFKIDNHVPKRAINIDQIILLSMNQLTDNIVYNPITGIQKISVVKYFSHMHHLVPALDKSKQHFKAISEIVKGIPVHSIDKSRLTKLDEFLKFIEDEITA